MAFTDVRIRNLRPKNNRYIAWEDGKTGFGLRISPTGRKSFLLMYREEKNGKARMMTIGNYPHITLSVARLKMAEAKNMIAKGVDPGKLWVKEKEEERRAETVKELAELYLEKWARPRKKSAKEDERTLNYDVLPAWGKRKAKDIKRRDVIDLLDNIVDRGAPIQANRTFAVIRKMFNFALSRDVLQASPCVAISLPSKENRRDRVLDEDEIRAFWIGLDKAKMGEGVKFLLKLQLLTAQRKGECLAAEWSDFDLPGKLWDIPSEKSKNNLTHRVPLSLQMVELLEEVKKYSGDSRWLFPTPRSKDIHMLGSSIDHAVRNNRRDFGIEPFTPHDLRRTAASLMTATGISRLVVSKILNHADRGVTAIYDRHSYDNEKRIALDAWGKKLEAIVTGKTESKVIPIVQAKQKG